MMGFSTVVIIVFIISLSFLLTQKGKDIVNTEVNNYLHEISQQTSYKVTQRVETNFSYLATLSNSLAYLDESAMKRIFMMLMKVELLNGLALLIIREC